MINFIKRLYCRFFHYKEYNYVNYRPRNWEMTSPAGYHLGKKIIPWDRDYGAIDIESVYCKICNIEYKLPNIYEKDRKINKITEIKYKSININKDMAEHILNALSIAEHESMSGNNETVLKVVDEIIEAYPDLEHIHDFSYLK